MVQSCLKFLNNPLDTHNIIMCITDVLLLNGNNGNVVISSNADAIAMELSNIKRKSEDAIASIDKHKTIIEQCDKALSIVKPNPISDENAALRNEIAEMRKLLMEQKKMFDKINKKQ